MTALLFFAAQIVCGEPVKTVEYDTPDRTPVYFGGESRAEDVHAREYCVFLDIFYADGTTKYAQTAEFARGTHDWQASANVVVPKKPVKRIEMFAFVRDGTGRAEFRNVFLKRENPARGTPLFEGRYSARPLAAADTVVAYTWNGKNARVPTERTAPEAEAFVCPLAPAAVDVWTADSMRRVTPLTFPSAAETAAPRAVVELARNERESVQVVVSAGAEASAEGVTLDVSTPVDAAGTPLAGEVTWARVACVPRRPGPRTHPVCIPHRERWLPEVLLPAAPFAVRPASSQCAWVTVRAEASAKPGDYRGTIAVRAAGGRTLATLPFGVRVWDFTLPHRFGLPASFSYMDGFSKPYWPDAWNEKRREAHDILLDHRLCPDDITRTDPVRPEDVAHMKARGANAWNILQVSPPKDPKAKWLCRPKPGDVFRPGFYASFTNRLVPALAALEARGLADGAYLYAFDECRDEYFGGMRDLYRRLKRDFPNLPILTTARMFNDVCQGKATLTDDLLSADWFCGSLHFYDPATADAFRRRGRKVWWYTCLAPDYPYMNFANIEYPAIEARLVLGVGTWTSRADGFLFWHVNYWCRGEGNRVDENGDTFLTGYDLTDNHNCPGDGILIYPGRNCILPGIRLANLRDGAEDWEYLALAERKAGREAVRAVVAPVCRSADDFSRTPGDLRAVRRRLAALITRP